MDIESLIPHREPIKIISEIIELSDDFGATAAVVNERWPLCDGFAVQSLVFIEAIAQTAAIVEGSKQRREGKGDIKGWLVGIKSAEFTRDTVPVGTRIVVQARSLYAMDNYGVIEGTVTSGGDLLMKAVIQAMRLNPEVA